MHISAQKKNISETVVLLNNYVETDLFFQDSLINRKFSNQILSINIS